MDLLLKLVLKIYIFLSPVGGEVAASEGGEATSAAGAPAEGEEGKDDVSVTCLIIQNLLFNISI